MPREAPWNPPLAWMDESACTLEDDKLFFPNGLQGENADRAKAICAVCPVFAECHERTTDETRKRPTDGVWAGIDHRKKRDGTRWN